MKDSVKFLIPPGSSRNIVDPPSLFVKISCDPPPPLKPPPPKVCWVYNDVVPTCKVIIALASWGSGGAVRSSGQSLRWGPGVGAHISSENPGVSNSKKWAILGIAQNNVGNCLENLPRSEERLDVLLQC